jgi:eukaryotic-like serine/threonine-protein kinase
VEGLLKPGMVIDGFRLEERLHQGSMATIWRVSGPGGEPLLMKTPLVREGDDPTAIVGFEGEQMILPTLSGVHLPRFVASGDFTEQPYIVMELIPGGSLRQRRLDAAPLPSEEVATIGARVADALHALHRQHVIHLDLKPSNVLFRESGEAVLIDLGLAHHDHLPDLLAEQFRLPMGTGPYISPEQIRGVRNDLRSDLFALGVMLYHLATGVRAFGQPTTVRGLRRRLYRDPVPPRARVSSVPPWLQEIILHCLEVDPLHRYQTAAQVAWDLQHPDQVRLTARAQRMKRDGALTVVRRWGRNLGRSPDPGHSAAGQLDSAPIVLVAIDVTQGGADLLAALRVTARRVFETEPGSRLACVTVLKTSRFAVDFDVDPEGHNVRVVRLVKLKHWARLLGVPEGRLTYHVLESPDPARAIIEFARANKVDHLVIGARGSSALRRYLGSVSSQVVAEADCTVTVVKSPVGAPVRQADPPPSTG